MTFDETNVVGNVYFAHYLHWQGHCRERFLHERAPTVLESINSGALAMVTTTCRVDFYAECFAFDVIDVSMTLVDSAVHRLRIAFAYRRGGSLVARGEQEVACMERHADHLRPVAIPSELLRALEPYRSPSPRLAESAGASR